jgi:1-acyl-sn-glycerol-3-phosphate acyltransferase
MSKYVRTVIAELFTFGAMVFLMPFGVVFAVMCLFGLFPLVKVLTYKLGKWWARIIIRLTGCTLDLRGTGNIPKFGGVCVVGNHSGIFDIALLLAYLDRPLSFIAKESFLWVPFLNFWIVMLGGHFIARSSPRRALKTMRKAQKSIEDGGAMIIFPEGTRSRGRGILPFKAGSLKMATASDIPILPVSIYGSYEVFEKTWLVQPVNVILHFHPLVQTAGVPHDERKQVLADRIRQIIVDDLGEYALPVGK